MKQHLKAIVSLQILGIVSFFMPTVLATANTDQERELEEMWLDIEGNPNSQDLTDTLKEDLANKAKLQFKELASSSLDPSAPDGRKTVIFDLSETGADYLNFEKKEIDAKKVFELIEIMASAQSLTAEQREFYKPIPADQEILNKDVAKLEKEYIRHEEKKAKEAGKTLTAEERLALHHKAVAYIHRDASNNFLLEITQKHSKKEIRLMAARILIMSLLQRVSGKQITTVRNLLNREFTTCSNLSDCETLIKELGTIADFMPHPVMSANILERIEAQVELLDRPPTSKSTTTAENPESGTEVPTEQYSNSLVVRLLKSRIYSLELYLLLAKAQGGFDDELSGKNPAQLDTEEEKSRIEYLNYKLRGPESVSQYVEKNSAKALATILKTQIFYKSKVPASSPGVPPLLALNAVIELLPDSSIDNLYSTFYFGLTNLVQEETDVEDTDEKDSADPIPAVAGEVVEKEVTLDAAAKKKMLVEVITKIEEKFSVAVDEFMKKDSSLLDIEIIDYSEVFVALIDSLFIEIGTLKTDFEKNGITKKDADGLENMLTVKAGAKAKRLHLSIIASLNSRKHSYLESTLKEISSPNFDEQSITRKMKKEILFLYASTVLKYHLASYYIFEDESKRCFTEVKVPMIANASGGKTEGPESGYLVVCPSQMAYGQFYQINSEPKKKLDENIASLKTSLADLLTPEQFRAKLQEEIKALEGQEGEEVEQNRASLQLSIANAEKILEREEEVLLKKIKSQTFKSELIQKLDDANTIAQELFLSQVKSDALYLGYQRLLKGSSVLPFLAALEKLLAGGKNPFGNENSTIEPSAFLLYFVTFAKFEIPRVTRPNYIATATKFAKSSQESTLEKIFGDNKEKISLFAETILSHQDVAIKLETLKKMAAAHLKSIRESLAEFGMTPYFTKNYYLDADDELDKIEAALARDTKDFHSFSTQLNRLAKASDSHYQNSVKAGKIKERARKQQFEAIDFVDSERHLKETMLTVVCFGHNLSPTFLEDLYKNRTPDENENVEASTEVKKVDLQKFTSDYIKGSWPLAKVCQGSTEQQNVDGKIDVATNVVNYLKSNDQAGYTAAIVKTLYPSLTNIGSVVAVSAVAIPLARYAGGKALERISNPARKKATSTIMSDVIPVTTLANQGKWFYKSLNGGLTRAGSGLRFIAGAAVGVGSFMGMFLGLGYINTHYLGETPWLPTFYIDDFENDPSLRDSWQFTKFLYTYSAQAAWTTAAFIVMPLMNRTLGARFVKKNHIDYDRSKFRNAAEYLDSDDFRASSLFRSYRAQTFASRVAMFGMVMPMAQNGYEYYNGRTDSIMFTKQDLVDGILFTSIFAGIDNASRSTSRWYKRSSEGKGNATGPGMIKLQSPHEQAAAAETSGLGALTQYRLLKGTPTENKIALFEMARSAGNLRGGTKGPFTPAEIQKWFNEGIPTSNVLHLEDIFRLARNKNIDLGT